MANTSKDLDTSTGAGPVSSFVSIILRKYDNINRLTLFGVTCLNGKYLIKHVFVFQ